MRVSVEILRCYNDYFTHMDILSQSSFLLPYEIIVYRWLWRNEDCSIEKKKTIISFGVIRFFLLIRSYEHNSKKFFISNINVKFHSS